MSDPPLTADVIQLGLKRRFRLIDCQGESRGFNDLLATQAKERRLKQAKDAWVEFRNAYADLVTKTAPDDPSDHAIKYIQDMRGRRP